MPRALDCTGHPAWRGFADRSSKIRGRGGDALLVLNIRHELLSLHGASIKPVIKPMKVSWAYSALRSWTRALNCMKKPIPSWFFLINSSNKLSALPIFSKN